MGSEYKLTPKVLFDHLLGETDSDRLAILDKVSLQEVQEKEVISYCQKNEQHLSYRAVISTVRDLKVADGHPDFSLSKFGGISMVVCLQKEVRPEDHCKKEMSFLE